MKVLILSIFMTISSLALSAQPVFDFTALQELDSKVLNTFQTLTGKTDHDEILKEYVSNISIRKTVEVKELRSNIENFLLSSYVDKSVFPQDYVLSFQGRELQQIEKKTGVISKITIQLLLEQLWYSSLILVNMPRPSDMRYLNTSDYLRMRLSSTFNLENVGAYAGPGNEWKRYAKQMTSTILILSLIVDKEGKNFGIPSFSYAVMTSDSVYMMFVDPYHAPNAYLIHTSCSAISSSDKASDMNKTQEEWFNFLRTNFEK